jgi:hypothetical protein
MKLERREDSIFEPIIKKLSTIASGLLPSGALVVHPMTIENIDY